MNKQQDKGLSLVQTPDSGSTRKAEKGEEHVTTCIDRETAHVKREKREKHGGNKFLFTSGGGMNYLLF